MIWKFRTDNLREVEECAHAILRQHRYRGCKRRCNEVYKMDIDDIKKVVAGCNKLALKLEYSRRKPLTAKGDFFMVLHRE